MQFHDPRFGKAHVESRLAETDRTKRRRHSSLPETWRTLALSARSVSIRMRAFWTERRRTLGEWMITKGEWLARRSSELA